MSGKVCILLFSFFGVPVLNLVLFHYLFPLVVYNLQSECMLGKIKMEPTYQFRQMLLVLKLTDIEFFFMLLSKSLNGANFLH